MTKMDVLRKSGSTLTKSISTVESPKLRAEQLAESFPMEAKHVFASVDAARGLAASIVFIHHLTVFFPVAFATLLGRDTLAAQVLKFVADLNTEAVMLFFVISGFCIRASSLKSDFARWDDVVYYGRRRFARIVPLYWFALAFAGATGAILGLTADHAFSLETLLGNLSFLQTSESARGTWFVPYGLNGPLWSISYEVFYYVLFPFALIAEARLGIRSATVSLILAFVFSVVAFVVYNVAPNPIMLFATYYCVWRLGVCTFDVLRDPREVRCALTFAIGVAIALSAIVVWHPSANLAGIRNSVIIAVLWIGVQSWPNARAFAAFRPVARIIGGFAWVGGISYGLYLLHHPVLRLLSGLLGDTVEVLVFATAVALIFAAFAEAGGLYVKYFILRRRTVPA
jgi:peptidoglycan/LPS O-acetylase OafA/YrhL